MPRDNKCMYMVHVCFYVCCSDCVGVCVNVCYQWPLFNLGVLLYVYARDVMDIVFSVCIVRFALVLVCVDVMVMSSALDMT